MKEIDDFNDALDEIQKLSKYTDILGSPEEYFKHMQGHTTELSLVLSSFSIADLKNPL